jgi:hypothetical protein
MRTIYKYTLRPDQIREDFTIEMPKDAIILSFGLQREKLVIWAEVNTDNANQIDSHRLGIFGTGNPLPEGNCIGYLATLILKA